MPTRLVKDVPTCVVSGLMIKYKQTSLVRQQNAVQVIKIREEGKSLMHEKVVLRDEK